MIGLHVYALRAVLVYVEKKYVFLCVVPLFMFEEKDMLMCEKEYIFTCEGSTCLC